MEVMRAKGMVTGYRFSSLLILILMAGLCPLTAAGGGDQPEAGPGELDFFWWGEESRYLATTAAVDAFNESRKDIHITAQSQGWDGYYEKMKVHLALGSAPDIFQFVTIWLSDFKKKPEVLYDLRRIGSLDLSGWPSTILDVATIGDRLVGTPLGYNARVLIYNRTLAEQLGLRIDGYLTWQDFNGMVQDARNRNPRLIGYSGDLNQLYYAMIAYLVQTSGNPLVTAEGRFGFTLEQLEEGLTLFGTWFNNGTFQTLEKTALFSSSWSDPAWLRGDVLFSECPMTQLDEQMDYDFPIGLTRYWVRKGARLTGIPVETNLMFCVDGKTEYPEEAGAFLNFILTGEEGVKLMMLQRGIPSNRKAYTLLADAGLISDISREAMGILKDSDTGKYTYWDTVELETLFKEAIQLTGFGDMSPREAAAGFMARGSALLDGNRDVFE